jgi:hypothetical protein
MDSLVSGVNCRSDYLDVIFTSIDSALLIFSREVGTNDFLISCPTIPSTQKDTIYCQFGNWGCDRDMERLSLVPPLTTNEYAITLSKVYTYGIDDSISFSDSTLVNPDVRLASCSDSLKTYMAAQSISIGVLSGQTCAPRSNGLFYPSFSSDYPYRTFESVDMRVKIQSRVGTCPVRMSKITKDWSNKGGSDGVTDPARVSYVYRGYGTGVGRSSLAFANRRWTNVGSDTTGGAILAANWPAIEGYLTFSCTDIYQETFDSYFEPIDTLKTTFGICLSGDATLANNYGVVWSGNKQNVGYYPIFFRTGKYLEDAPVRYSFCASTDLKKMRGTFRHSPKRGLKNPWR